mgnify:CR=1 FL=1
MIPYAWMGGLALVVLWVNTLLVAAVALKSAAWIRRHRMPRRLTAPSSGDGLAMVQVESGGGPDGHLADHRIEQRGRKLSGDEAAIGWHDRQFQSRVYGGRARWAGVPVQVQPPGEEAEVEVWPDRDTQLRRAALPERAALDDALERARRAKGELREVVVPVAPGDTAWIAGRFREVDDGFVVTAPEDGPLLVSRVDPRAWAAAAQSRLLAFAVAVVAIAGGITALCLVPPAFGTASTIGGALALGFFLLVQPAGTWIRDRMLPPPHRPLEGRWSA